MENEFKRMQELAGVPVTEDKSIINENFVGIPAINNPFADREKTDYENAFEHFLGQKYELKEEIDEEEVKEDNLYSNELASLEPEGRFWIVSWRGMDGPKEKVFTDEDEARAFMDTLYEGKEVEESNN